MEQIKIFLETKNIAYEDVEQHVAKQLAAIRGILLLVKKHAFQQLWELSSVDQKVTAYDLIKLKHLKGLKAWFLQHPENDFEFWLTKDLLILAKKYQIKNYSRLTRSILINKLREKHYGR